MTTAVPDRRNRRLRAKNLALLVALVGIIVLFYVITLVRIGAVHG